jgi:uncharacterized protein
MRTITLEEHYATPAFIKGPGRDIAERAKRLGGRATELFEALPDIGAKRIAAMDAARIDVQVLSLTAPGFEQMDGEEARPFARDTNDALAAATRQHPGRLAGFAALPTGDPKAAATELERCVRDLGFKGTLINGHIRGRYMDDKFFWPIFESAVALDVPVYMHPARSPQAVVDALYKGFSDNVNTMLSLAGWGWHIETAIHVVRIILGGVFDQFPKLQICIGHLGETLPFMLRRLDVMTPEATGLKHPISHYLRNNVHYTFGGFNFTAPFLNLLLEVGVDRIMFSADYPYASMPAARAFLDQLPVSPADRERIAHGNAERLLRM